MRIKYLKLCRLAGLVMVIHPVAEVIADDNLGAYAGVRIGQGIIETNVDYILFSGQQKTVSSDPEFVGGLFAGYMFHPNWGVEASLDSLGEYPLGLNGIGTVKETVDLSAFSAVVKGSLPLGKAVAATARLGGAYIRSQHTAAGTAGGNGFVFSVAKEDNVSSFVPLVGLGFDWKFSRSLGLRLDYEHYLRGIDYDDKSKLDLDLWTVGLYYQFGH